MKGSLQEQLLKSGLIDEDRLANAKKSVKKEAVKSPKEKKMTSCTFRSYI